MIYRVADKNAINLVPKLEQEQTVLTDVPGVGIDISDLLAELKPPDTLRYPKIVLAKLFIPFYAKEDYSLYLDLDTEIVGDISPLLNAKFDEIIAARHDDDFYECYNSGILIFNCKRYRKEFTIEGIIKEINDYKNNKANPDFVSDENIFCKLEPKPFKLEPRYNVFPGEHIENPVILHYAFSYNNQKSFRQRMEWAAKKSPLAGSVLGLEK